MRSLIFLSLSFLLSVCDSSSSASASASLYNFDFSEIPDFNEKPFSILTSEKLETRNIGLPVPKPSSASTIKNHQVEVETTITALPFNNTAIPKPVKIPRTVSEVTNISTGTPKRKKTLSSVHSADKPIEQIINDEVSRCGFKSEDRIAQFRNTLYLISINNYQLFMEDQINFKNVFGFNYYIYKKDDSIVLYRFMLLFGADKLLPSLEGRRIIFKESYISAFNYLLETKQFDDVIRMLVSYRFIDFAEEAKTSIQAALLARCPESLHLKRSLIKLIGHSIYLNDYIFIIDAPESQETFDRFAQSIKIFDRLPTGPGVLRAIVQEKIEYYRNTSKVIKFSILQSVLSVDSLEVLFHLLSEDPDIRNKILESCY